MPPAHTTVCPRCSSNRIKRSHSRSIIEKSLKTLNIRAYRCIHCGWRGYRIGRESPHAKTAKYSLLQLLSIVIVLAIVTIVLLYYLTREEPKQEIILGKRGESARLISTH